MLYSHTAEGIQTYIFKDKSNWVLLVVFVLGPATVDFQKIYILPRFLTVIRPVLYQAIL